MSIADTFSTNIQASDKYDKSNQHETLAAEEEEDEDDGEDLNQPAPAIKRISARKQKNAAIFDTFLKEVAKQPKTEKISHADDEAVQSTRWLIEQAEKQHIIESPRDYQLELFEKAKKQNLIAVLDTGMFFPYLLSLSVFNSTRLWQNIYRRSPTSLYH